MAIAPLETHPVLIVDTDAMLSLTVASQSFRTVTWQRREIVQAVSVMQQAPW
ncbi:MAG: hypothetical protein ETSY1_21485 [Candidatus Entotheonella factor]|uniref:Uncharacterized protein n=1 Tax=Entotheonella factor TaxID=1429438 RepID=W4LJ43_ENTF1|nr:MAG: hypothetical protein ETSY1_21485 [Candidatus Entotheonella factor]